jgi:hypothetical protein
MARLAKNTAIVTGSTAIRVPFGSSAQRPESPVFGQFRYNVDIGLLEFFNGTIFQTLSPSGSLTYTVDSFIGDGSTTDFNMSEVESDPQQIIVFVGSIYQDPNLPNNAYTVNDTITITFTSPPPAGEPISVIHSTT